MARFKDFGAGASNGAPAEKITFKLHDEEFECIPEIPGKTILDLVAKSGGEDAGESAAVVTGFFDTVLTPESNARFNVLAADPVRIVSMETLSNIIEWLVEQYTDRPTQRPEASLSGE
jgi:hypothetical protein